MKKTTVLFSTTLLAILFMTLSQAGAHNVWINVENHFPKKGDVVDIGIGWGHTYPKNRLDQELKPGNLDHIRVVDPDGIEVAPERISETAYTLKIEKEGAYLVTAGARKGVFTQTPKGREWRDKKGVENPISCTHYTLEAKSLIIAGESNRNIDGVTGQELEVIPLTDPRFLKAGDTLSLKVLFRGKALSGLTVNAAYAGFSEEKKGTDIAPHQNGATGKQRGFPASTATDADGRAMLTLSKPGYWMVTLSHKSPYPDKEACDQYMHNMTFTIEIR